MNSIQKSAKDIQEQLVAAFPEMDCPLLAEWRKFSEKVDPWSEGHRSMLFELWAIRRLHLLGVAAFNIRSPVPGMKPTDEEREKLLAIIRGPYQTAPSPSESPEETPLSKLEAK